MTDSFTMYEGEDAEPYYPITDIAGVAIDLDNVEEVVFVAADPDTHAPIFTPLHLSDGDSQITIDYDPTTPTPTIKNTIFVHLLPADTDGHIGQWRHEVRVLLAGWSTVVYPAVVGELATFSVVESLTWNEATHVPRLMRVSRDTDTPKQSE